MKKFLMLIFNAKSYKKCGARDEESMSIPYILQCTIQYNALCHVIKFLSVLFSQKQSESESFHLNLSNSRTLVCCELAGRSHVLVFSRVEGEEMNEVKVKVTTSVFAC